MILKLRNILSVWCGFGYIFLVVENILRIGDCSFIRCIFIGLWGEINLYLEINMKSIGY